MLKTAQVNPDPTSYDGHEYVIMHKTPSGRSLLLGVVAFTNGKLTFINRSWTPGEDKITSVAVGLYGAISEANRRGRFSCATSAADQQNPTANIKAVYLECKPGKSVIHVTLTTYDDKESVSVEEILKAE